jgi:hypothetical protein
MNFLKGCVIKFQNSSGEELFDFLAECIKDFLEKNIDPDSVNGKN